MTKKKKKSIEDRFLPIDNVPSLKNISNPAENPRVVKKIIQGAIQGAFQLKMPSEYDLKHTKPLKTLASEDDIQFVVNLIESLEPTNVIEAALASQFAITYIRGLKRSQGTYPIDLASTLQLFEFGHKVLETLNRYRTKGAQLISVNYNHNQGQINNIKIVEGNTQSETIEVKA